MPSQAEHQVVDPFGDVLDSAFKGDDLDKPNALLLARITWNGTRELIYRVFDPESANHYLTKVIETGTHPKQLDYRMEHDLEWKLAA